MEPAAITACGEHLYSFTQFVIFLAILLSSLIIISPFVARFFVYWMDKWGPQ